MKPSLLLWATCLAGLTSPALAVDNTGPASAVGRTISDSAVPATNVLPTIQVTGGTDIEWKTYRTFLNALAAAEQHRDLAPEANPRFMLRPKLADMKFDGLTLEVVGKKTSIRVPIGPDGEFELPRTVADENVDLALSAKPGLFQWRPYVRSPNTSANSLRLGDLRLECEMRWAIEKESLSFTRRSMLAMLGGPCRTSRVKVMYPAPQKLAEVTLVSGSRRESLLPDRIIGDGHSFSPPIHDQSWPNDTMVTLRFSGS